jgi:hypothetical protein
MLMLALFALLAVASLLATSALAPAPIIAALAALAPNVVFILDGGGGVPLFFPLLRPLMKPYAPSAEFARAKSKHG